MSTTGIDSWAVDLADITTLYPFAGAEFLMFVIGFALWIIWHIWHIRFENRTYEEDLKHLDSPEKIERAMREQRMD